VGEVSLGEVVREAQQGAQVVHLRHLADEQEDEDLH
jgi:hypothetical protein